MNGVGAKSSMLCPADCQRHTRETSYIRMSSADVAASETDNPADVKSTRLRQKDVERGASRRRRHHLTAFAIAAFCHFTRPTAAQGETPNTPFCARAFISFRSPAERLKYIASAVHGKPISELYVITITQCYLPPNKGECAPSTQPGKPVLDLATPEG